MDLRWVMATVITMHLKSLGSLCGLFIYLFAFLVSVRLYNVQYTLFNVQKIYIPGCTIYTYNYSLVSNLQLAGSPRQLVPNKTHTVSSSNNHKTSFAVLDPICFQTEPQCVLVLSSIFPSSHLYLKFHWLIAITGFSTVVTDFCTLLRICYTKIDISQTRNISLYIIIRTKKFHR